MQIGQESRPIIDRNVFVAEIKKSKIFRAVVRDKQLELDEPMRGKQTSIPRKTKEFLERINEK